MRSRVRAITGSRLNEHWLKYSYDRLPGENPEGSVGPNQAAFGLITFMGGTAQFIAGIMEFRVGNMFGTTVHCSYGAFWLSYAMYLLPYLGIQAAYGGEKTRAYTLQWESTWFCGAS
jgi:Predicted membrane protein